MKKSFVFVLGLAALMLMGTASIYKVNGEVFIKVINENGEPIEWTYFDAKFYTPPGESFEIMTDADGNFEIADEYAGDKITINSYSMIQDGTHSRWTDINPTGTTIKCFKDTPPPLR